MPVNTIFQEQNIPAWMIPITRGLAERSEAIGSAPYTPYRGQRLVPMNQREAMEMLAATRSLHGEYMGHFNAADQQLGSASQEFPAQYQRYMNPYMNHVVNRIQEEGTRTFGERILPELEGKFLKMGQHGSRRHRDISLRAARDIQAEILGKQREALAHGYGQAHSMFSSDKARAAEVARSRSTIGLARHGLKLADISALEAQFAKQRDERQRGADIAYADFLRQQEYPRERAAHQSALLQGLPMPNTGASHSYDAPPAQVNTAGQIGNLAGNILGAVNAMAPQQSQQSQQSWPQYQQQLSIRNRMLRR
jgi:hypothetical protein